ncbi:hypothetical protein [Eleftheria terrae]|uniref:hypothetical protein n=1 Tax=Eleftheria terrae TaxID=1597781 RepID=UPI00263B284E|nr:hypothetical protein [Eleftheria terrae]WKB56151.1 hypothetical protein N7L95_29355 [Eleftheria terrae]
MTLSGGLGTPFAPLAGALVIIAPENRPGDIGNALAHSTGLQCFASLGDSGSTVMGLIFVCGVLAFRKGVVGTVSSRPSR